MGTLRFFEEVVSFKIRRTFGFADYIFGHEHRWIEEDIFGDGMMYYGCPNIEKRTYILYTLTPDGYSYEKVDF